MKFNGAIVSKPLKDELEKVLTPLEEKIDESAANAMEYRGTWNASTQYKKNDVVIYNGQTYIANKDNRASAPNSPTWSMIAIIPIKTINHTTLEDEYPTISTWHDIFSLASKPEAIFKCTIEQQALQFRAVKAEYEQVTLSATIMPNANMAMIYTISIDYDKQNDSYSATAYKATLNSTGVSIASITAPNYNDITAVIRETQDVYN